MVTPQIYIPDEKCRLDFDAQGFRSAKNDKLKVIVYADETIYNYLTADLCTKMRTEGKVLMDEVVLPGASDTNWPATGHPIPSNLRNMQARTSTWPS